MPEGLSRAPKDVYEEHKTRVAEAEVAEGHRAELMDEITGSNLLDPAKREAHTTEQRFGAVSDAMRTKRELIKSDAAARKYAKDNARELINQAAEDMRVDTGQGPNLEQGHKSED